MVGDGVGVMGGRKGRPLLRLLGVRPHAFRDLQQFPNLAHSGSPQHETAAQLDALGGPQRLEFLQVVLVDRHRLGLSPPDAMAAVR